MDTIPTYHTVFYSNVDAIISLRCIQVPLSILLATMHVMANVFPHSVLLLVLMDYFSTFLFKTLLNFGRYKAHSMSDHSHFLTQYEFPFLTINFRFVVVPYVFQYGCRCIFLFKFLVTPTSFYLVCLSPASQKSPATCPWFMGGMNL